MQRRVHYERGQCDYNRPGKGRAPAKVGRSSKMQPTHAELKPAVKSMCQGKCINITYKLITLELWEAHIGGVAGAKVESIGRLF